MDPVRIFAILIAVVVVSASAEGDTWSSSPLGKMGQGSKKERVCGIDVIDLTKEGKWKIPQSCTRLSNAAQALLEEVHSAKYNRVCALADIDRNQSKWVIPPDCKELHLDESSIGDGAAAFLAEALIYTSAEALYLADNAIGDAGAVSIAGALKANVVLRNVDLSGNSIGDIGAASIAEALSVNTAILEMGLFSNSIGDELIHKIKAQVGTNVCKASCSKIRANPPLFSRLNLGSTEYYIGDGGATLIAEALKGNTGITALMLQNNHIGDIGMASLAEALKANTNIKEVYLARNAIGDVGAASVADALKVNTAITAVLLKSNNIGPTGTASLAEALRVNTALERIDLDGNSIGDAGAASIARALVTNKGLTKVDLSSNNIGSTGVAAMAKALEVNTNIMTAKMNFLNSNVGEDQGLLDSIDASCKINRGIASDAFKAKLKRAHNPAAAGTTTVGATSASVCQTKNGCGKPHQRTSLHRSSWVLAVVLVLTALVLVLYLSRSAADAAAAAGAAAVRSSVEKIVSAAKGPDLVKVAAHITCAQLGFVANELAAGRSDTAAAIEMVLPLASAPGFQEVVDRIIAKHQATASTSARARKRKAKGR